MMSTSNDSLNLNQLPVSVEIPRDPVKGVEIISLLYKRIAASVNSKEGGLFPLAETGNFQQFYTTGNAYAFRPVYRYTFDLVALNSGNISGGATVTFAHGIVGLLYTTLLYASCTSVAGDFFTVVYPDASASATNIIFTNPLGSTALSNAVLVFEYLKN